MAQVQTINGNTLDIANERLTVRSGTATATVFNGACRLKSINVQAGGSAGTIVFRDGGPGGTIKFTVYCAANTNNDIQYPHPGVEFATDLHVTLSNITGFTLAAS